MSDFEDEKQYSEVIDALKGLKKVKAPENFEADLMRRINSQDFVEEKSFWQKLFIPSWLVPAATLSAVAIIALIYFFNSNSSAGNPLLEPPRLREDVIATNETPPPIETKTDKETKVQNEGKVKDKSSELTTNKTRKQEKEIASNDKDKNDKHTVTEPTAVAPVNNPPSSLAGFHPIDKNKFNFRHITMNQQEKAGLDSLRKKTLIDSTFNKKARHNEQP